MCPAQDSEANGHTNGHVNSNGSSNGNHTGFRYDELSLQSFRQSY